MLTLIYVILPPLPHTADTSVSNSSSPSPDSITPLSFLTPSQQQEAAQAALAQYLADPSFIPTAHRIVGGGGSGVTRATGGGG